jgi:hypothetical protein
LDSKKHKRFGGMEDGEVGMSGEQIGSTKRFMQDTSKGITMLPIICHMIAVDTAPSFAVATESDFQMDKDKHSIHNNQAKRINRTSNQISSNPQVA